MLTKLIVKNFKKFKEVEIELGNPVLFIGPNNSGKTSALQALALWGIGLKRWQETWGLQTPAQKERNDHQVTLNRRDLVAIPVPNANLLWRELQVQNVRIDVIVEGITNGIHWHCGLEFEYANEESFYCRSLRLSENENPDRMPVPAGAGAYQLAFLPPMSGLLSNETLLNTGAINVRIGEGRTAEVLRNICYKIYTDNNRNWTNLLKQMHSLFRVEVHPPRHISERGEIQMSYTEKKVLYDLSASGRGFQQTLLLLSYLYAHKGAVLLMDEPDAHLEIIRQREIYELLNDTAKSNNNQVIIASHSEALLAEAADRDVVVAFVGQPHQLNRRSQVSKALSKFKYEDYCQAEETGWVLYLEGATDIAILRAFALTLEYEDAISALARPFVYYVGNDIKKVQEHFYGLREAVTRLKGIAIFDRLDRELPDHLGAKGMTWRRREIENYLCSEAVMMGYAASLGTEKAKEVMAKSILEMENAMKTLRKGSPWDTDTKVSDDFLTPLFENFFKELGIPNMMAKTNFHVLAQFVPRTQLDEEIKEKLDAIVEASGTTDE